MELRGCPACGAANSVRRAVCFACGAPLPWAAAETGLRPAGQSPEAGGVRFEQSARHIAGVEFGGFWRRAGALLVDNFLLAVVAGVVGTVISAVQGSDGGRMTFGEARAVAQSAAAIPLLLMQFVYFAGFESSRLQATPGKLLLGIEVCDLYGEPITFWRALGRYLAKLVTLVLMVGLAIVLVRLVGDLPLVSLVVVWGPLAALWAVVEFTPLKQAPHDFLARTAVVRV